MTREEFKQRWESDEEGGGITFNDVAKCAIDWGIMKNPTVTRKSVLRYVVLKAAHCVDAELYNPDTI